MSENTISTISPCAARKVMEVKMEEHGVELKLPTTQTLFGYARSGKIASNYKIFRELRDAGDKDIQVLFDADSFLSYLRSWLKGEVKVGNKINAQQLADQFNV
jgi:hypothetical protein